MELNLNNISKQYHKGSTWALREVTLAFTPGVYGLLGPNGAGKSTLMNIITDNLKYDSGEITLNSVAIKKLGKNYREQLGYMPQQQSLFDEFTAHHFLWYMAALKGLKKEEAKEQIASLVSIVNLQDSLYKRLKSFSGGMKQRILIAQALLGNPNILILDEPTAGLDPKERIRIRNFISEIGKDKIVMIATHVVSDIEYIAKEIVLLRNGQVLKQGSPSQLLEHISDNVFEVMVQENELPKLQEQYKVSNIQRSQDTIVTRVVTENSISGYEARLVTPNLEELYLYMFE